MSTRRASPIFWLIVLVTLGLFGLLGAVLFLPGVGGLFGSSTAAHAGQHFREHHHRVHDLTFGFLFGTAALGMLAQLLGPLDNVAGQLMALIPWTALLLVVPLTSYWAQPGTGFVMAATALFGVLTLNAALFHPAGGALFASFSRAGASRVMLGLVAVEAAPLLAFASTNAGLQRVLPNDHAALGHYGFMAAFCFTAIGVGLLASLRPAGWRLPAAVAALLPALLGLASLLFPDVDSGLGPLWSPAAIVWGAAFAAVALFDRRPARA